MALFSALIACLYMYSLVDALIDILTFTLNIRYLLKSNVLYETIYRVKKMIPSYSPPVEEDRAGVIKLTINQCFIYLIQIEKNIFFYVLMK